MISLATGATRDYPHRNPAGIERQNNDAPFAKRRLQAQTVAKQPLNRLSAAALFCVEALSRPWQIGAVAPSSRRLAAAMARWVPAERRAWIVELGPGTGAVTQALIECGHAPDRLLAIEKSAKMADLLRKHFPHAQVVTGDALDLESILAAHGCPPGDVAAVFSSLPLMNFGAQTAETLALRIHEALRPDGVYVQYTYHVYRQPPVPLHRKFRHQACQIVWPNLPPARVSVYRKA